MWFIGTTGLGSAPALASWGEWLVVGPIAWAGNWSSVAGFSAGGDDGRAGAALGRGFGWRA